MTSPAPLKKHTLACIRCSERKVRCDKQSPCNACVRHNVRCVFRLTKPSRRKRDFSRDEELVDERLQRYEALLLENGIDPGKVPGTLEAEHHRKSSHAEVPATGWKLPPRAAVFKPKLRRGVRGTDLVDKQVASVESRMKLNFQQHLVGKGVRRGAIHDTEDALEDDSANDISDGATSSDEFAYVLGPKPPITASAHPPTRLIHQLWQIFVENVNPLTKLVHVPSLQPAIDKAITDIEHVPKGFEALMFAIYSMAVLSLAEEECRQMLGETRAMLLPRYVAATKRALSRARFMSSTSTVVLQALVLHILSIRDVCEPRALWNLTGVAIRVAEGMGMHLDGMLLGLSPFETEIRRRIWWQLRMYDLRAAELSGQAKVWGYDIDETTPKKPANINDSDLYPTMPQAGAESTKSTEMMWCMLRFELADFAATQKARMHKTGKAVLVSDDYAAMDINELKMKDIFAKEIEDKMETKYLRFCDPSQPLHLMALLCGRSTTNIVRFMAHHPRRWANLDHVPASEQQLVWNIVVQLLEQFNMMQSSPQLRRFAWSVPYSIQWHAVIHVLDKLRADPLHLDAVKVWRLIETLYENNFEMLLSIKKPLFVAIGNLCLKAFSARAAALTKEQRSLSDPPEYIIKLRQQREAAKTRREAAKARGRGREILYGQKRLATTDADATYPDANPRPAEALAQAQPQQYSEAKQPSNPIQENTRMEGDAFWLSNTLDDSFFAGGAASMMSLDTDAILSQEYWLDTPPGEVIDWARWDAWLGNTDPTHPNVGAGSR